MIADRISNLTSYRAALYELDAAATPTPWSADGEFYGVVRDGRFHAIGFAPHHGLDPVLIAAYRNHLATVLCTVDAVGHHLRRAAGDETYGAAEAVAQVLNILDDEQIDDVPLTTYLARLDKLTTQPLWDAGHLAMGMDILEHVDSVNRLLPAPGDPFLIAAVRTAIPRALMFLSAAAIAFADVPEPGRLDCTVAGGLLALLDEFDGHRVDEGSGTATV